MQIQFIYSSNTLGGREHVERVLTQLPVFWGKHQIDDVEHTITVSEDHIVTVCIEVLVSDAVDSDRNAQIATRTLQAFADLTGALDVVWHVGHQLDPKLGTIVDGQLPTKLVNEVRMALNVAESFAGMIVDDEFVEPDSVFDAETFLAENALPDEESWNGLLESGDSFIRFPEFE